MKRLMQILVVLFLSVIMTAGLAETITDPGAGKPTVEMPSSESFDNPAILVPGTFYRGEAGMKYQLAFTPSVSGTYTVYAKTDGQYSLWFQILDEYSHSIGWSFNNNESMIPFERNVDLEAGKTYHLSGTYYNDTWSSGSFSLALYPADYSKETVGLPAMESFDNPCRIQTDVTYRGVSGTKYQLLFVPEVSGTYLVYCEADTTSAVNFGIYDRNREGIGWSFYNREQMGPMYHAVEMKAGEEYHFIGQHYNSTWSSCSFSFSLSRIDENSPERFMSAMTNYNNPGHLIESVHYSGTSNIAYIQDFVPEKDGLYAVSVTTDSTTHVEFKVVDQYQQEIGWYMNNGDIKGTRTKNILLKADTTYFFVGTYYNSCWSNGSFNLTVTPSEGENASLLPAMEHFTNPGVVEAGILYHGDAHEKYVLRFTPSESGLYSIYAQTEQPKPFYIKLLNEYQESAGWKMGNGEKQAPAISSVELEAGKEYYLAGDYYNAAWSNDRFQFAICAPSRHAADLSDFQVIQAPTCTEPGVSAQLCTLCQQPVHLQELPAAGHVPGEPVVSQQATCLTPGVQIIQCTVCNEVITQEEIPVTGHQPGVWADLKPVTCTADGLRVQRCTVCNETLNTETVPAFGHSPMEWQITRESACLQSGLREQQCAICGIALAQEEIPALGHSYTEWETTIEPTKEAEGERTRHCIHCGDTQQEPIEKLDKFLGIF